MERLSKPAPHDLTPRDTNLIIDTQGAIWWMEVNADGCKFRLSGGEHFLLELAHANYNALFSLMLVAWANAYQLVTITSPRIGLVGDTSVRRVISISAWPS